MLPPVTTKCVDHSTDKYFEFAFFCDSCGSEWLSERYSYSLADSPPRGDGERSAYAILYKAEHDAAYERANTEALFHFNRCGKCGMRVCDKCFRELEPLCIRCSGKTR